MGGLAGRITADRVEGRSPNGVSVVAEHSTRTNELLVGALHERGVRAQLAKPARLGRFTRRGDVVLGRLDVRGTLDGVEDGIGELRRVERRGTRVLNPAGSLIARPRARTTSGPGEFRHGFVLGLRSELTRASAPSTTAAARRCKSSS